MTSKIQINSRNLRKVLLVGTAVGAMAAFATPVLAAGEDAADPGAQQIFVSQMQNPGDVGFIQPDDPAGGGGQADDDSGDRIVVTGSRIARDPFAQPAPVVQLDSELIGASALVSVSDVLLRNPQIAVGVGLQNVANSGLVGANFTNLRGLGIQRSLALINGKRRVPGDTMSTAVDLGAIPPAMIERIEILTGGTSAVYGADAVTGVVNVILKEDFEGLEISGQAGVPQQGGGGDSQQVSIVGGANFNDSRGNVLFGLSYDHSQILDGLDRDFTRGLRISQFRPNQANTSGTDGIPDTILVRDVVTATFPNNGGFFFFNGNQPFDVAPGAGQSPRFNWFTDDGSGLRPIRSDFAQCFNSGCFFDVRTQGGDGFRFEDYNTLRAGFERLSGMAKIEYEIFDSVEFYAQFDASSTDGISRFQAPFNLDDFASIPLTRDNPFLSPSVTAFMDDPSSVLPGAPSTPLTTIFANRTHDDIGRRTNNSERTTISAIAGFKGEISETWNFDVFAQFGQTDVDFRSTGSVLAERLAQAFDVISDPVTGQPVCRDAGARAAGCLPLRALGPENDFSDPDFRRWLYHEPISNSRIEQELIGAQITGDLFELPAGTVAVAGGFEYRKEEIQFRDDPTRDDVLLQTAAQPEDGSLSVWELFGEGVVPLLKDMPLAHDLQIEGAVRYSNYDQIFGSTWAWKAGGSWSPVEDIRFRVSRSKSVRAPSITDLFTPGSTNFIFPSDPCSSVNINNGPNRVANCAALGIPVGYTDPAIFLKPQTTGGNPALLPETSKSWTIGGVISPRFIPNLRLAIDYWDIELIGAVGSLPFQDIVNNCVDSATINNVFCPFIERNPAGSLGEFEISLINNRFLNVSNLEASGVDFQMDYRGDLADHFFGELPGEFRINVAGTFLDKNNQLVDNTDPDSLLIFAGEVGLPHWRLNSNVSYSIGALTVNWFLNFLSATDTENQPASEEAFPVGFDRIPSRVYNNIALAYDVNETLTLTAGVNNILVVDTPDHPFVVLGGGGLYDNQGRFFFAGGRVRF